MKKEYIVALVFGLIIISSYLIVVIQMFMDQKCNEINPVAKSYIDLNLVLILITSYIFVFGLIMKDNYHEADEFLKN